MSSHTVTREFTNLSLFPQAKVVDDNGQTVPVGATGELLIRGYCVMLGYWQDEAKNRETITPSRWYKTG